MAANLGIERFTIQLAKCKASLQLAIQQEDVVHSLYENQFRTQLFMLEGLAKLYNEIQPSKHFKKILQKVKLLEDAFGAYDYYLALLAQYGQQKQIPEQITSYFTMQLAHQKDKIAAILEEDKWLSGKRIEKIIKKLKKIAWLTPKKEQAKIIAALRQQINEIIAFCNDSMPFNDMELHVHELRRKLRWLSIYPQAANGLFGLATKQPAFAVPKKYLTKQIIASPYNQFRQAAAVQYPVLLDKNAFLALSWLINKLGELKDKGLTAHTLSAAFEKNYTQKDKTQKHAAFIKAQGTDIGALLEECNSIVEQFLQAKILQHLL